MKTLLIDNYDSYTHILGHYLWKLTGQEPLIIKNDTLSLGEINKLQFDNVVISPGPGRPEIPSDFGVCREVLEMFSQIPTLGVCLGHQGLGVYTGAKIVHAPQTMHGKYSLVHHNGDPLFKGIEKTFKVVRYHSLVIDPHSLSDSLEVLATSGDDNQIMAIKHKERPFYGVQFHPESVGTESGEQLLLNFLNFANNWNSQLLGAARKGEVVELDYREVPWRDPEDVFVHLFKKKEYAFWLDSNFPGNQQGFSYMGIAEEALEITGNLATIKQCDPTMGKWKRCRVIGGEPYEVIGQYMDTVKCKKSHPPFPFQGGLVGYFAYEFGSNAVQVNSNWPESKELPDSILMKAHRFLVFDHASQKGWVAAVSQEEDAASETWLNTMRDTVNALSEQPSEESEESPSQVPPVHGASFEKGIRSFSASLTKKEYLDSIKEIKKLIRDGESYEVCLTNEFSLRAGIHPWELYRLLRRINPAPYSAYLAFPQGSILCSSPESFIRVGEDRTVVSEPMKGTRPKGRTQKETKALREDLLSSAKDNSELLMITDLLRNNLSRVCRPGSVQVSTLKKITEYATVLQQTSTITGNLRENYTNLDVLRACFPGGSITGAPKIRTMEIISRFEKRKRGVYTGSIGYLGYDGTMNLNIAIRTAVVEGENLSFGAGGAIVADSIPQKEWEEVVLKAEAVYGAFIQPGKTISPIQPTA